MVIMKWLKFFSPVKSISREDADQIMKDKSSKECVLLDVREPAEYAENNIKGSMLIPLGNLWHRASELDRDKTTLIYCRSGSRSKMAARILAVKGFVRVSNIAGGMMGMGRT
jgi:rhodanese-related sulfurtransferase